MANTIPPTPLGPSGPYYSHQPDPNQLKNELIQFEQEIRHDIGPPLQEHALLQLMPKLENFLKDNKEALIKLMEKNGYPLHGPFSITTELNSAIGAIEDYIKHPNTGALYMTNESVTQLNFYLKHPYQPS